MPIYAYKGLDKNGKEIKNTVNVESILAAKQRVKSLGIMLIDIREQKAQGTGGSRGANTGDMAWTWKISENAGHWRPANRAYHIQESSLAH